MPSRLTLLLLLAACLYLAPLLSGWARGDRAAAPLALWHGGALAAWGALYRSGPWPASRAEWASAGGLLRALGLALLMVALAAGALLAGRGLAWATAPLPLPPALPLALGPLALALALGLMPPARARAMDALLDDALAGLAAAGRAADPEAPAADALVARLRGLPADAGAEEVGAWIAGAGLPAWALREAVGRAPAATTTRPLRVAAILAATDPADPPWDREAMGLALDLARGDAGLLALLADRALALVAARPDLAGTLPLGFDLAQAAAEAPGVPGLARLRALSGGEG